MKLILGNWDSKSSSVPYIDRLKKIGIKGFTYKYKKDMFGRDVVQVTAELNKKQEELLDALGYKFANRERLTQIRK